MHLCGKDYFTVEEAAAYACVSPSQFRAKAPALGLAPFQFMGKLVYRRADIQRAMEQARSRLSINADRPGISTGRIGRGVDTARASGK